MTPVSPVVVPALMAGGSGTRLWPLSREDYPKQFLSLMGQESLLVEALRRVGQIPEAAQPLILGSEAHRFLIAEQIRCARLSATILLEPASRNTAAAAAVAAHWAIQHAGAQAIVLLMPSDQYIRDEPPFLEAIGTAIKVAASGRMVLLGIPPQRAETGFGYIRAGARLAESPAYEVDAFVEKPDLARAQTFLVDGNYFWNSGAVVFPAQLMIDELRRLEPELERHAQRAVRESQVDMDFQRLAESPFLACRSVSLDYAVIEKTRNIALVPLEAGWDDIGSWSYLASHLEPDGQGNRMSGDVIAEDAGDNLVLAESRLVALLGVKRQLVVETADAILVADRDRVQDVRSVVARLQGLGRSEARRHPRVHRPWGWYQTLALGERFQVKRIQVHAGQRLSLQLHHHRAEHWIVVNGTAEVICGDRTFLLAEDQSTYIPVGTRHRLSNPGRLPLDLIEVQSGTYLGEDDIVRFDDLYGRSPGAQSTPPGSGLTSS